MYGSISLPTTTTKNHASTTIHASNSVCLQLSPATDWSNMWFREAPTEINQLSFVSWLKVVTQLPVL